MPEFQESGTHCLVWSFCVDFGKAKYEHIHHPFPSISHFSTPEASVFVFCILNQGWNMQKSGITRAANAYCGFTFEIRASQFLMNSGACADFFVKLVLLLMESKGKHGKLCICKYRSTHMCQTHLVERLTQVTRFDGFSMPKGHTIIESLWSSFEQKIDWWILTTNLKTDSGLVDQGASKQQEEVMQWIVALTNQRPAVLRWVHCRNVEVWATANQIRCGATRQTFSALARA